MFRIYRKIRDFDFVRSWNHRKTVAESSFYEQNRKEVLESYRYLLKTVPKIYQRTLQQRSIYNEICHLFKVSKVLSCIQETRQRNEHLKKMVEDIKRGDYSNMGAYIPARGGEYVYLRAFFHRLKRFRLE